MFFDWESNACLRVIFENFLWYWLLRVGAQFWSCLDCIQFMLFTLKIYIFMHLNTSPIHWIHPWYLIDLSNFKDNFWIFLDTSLTPLQSIETIFSTFFLANTSPTPSWSIETFSYRYHSTHWILKLDTSLIYQDYNLYLYTRAITQFISITLTWISLWPFLIPFDPNHQNQVSNLIFGLSTSSIYVV